MCPGVCIECWTLNTWLRMCPGVCIVLNHEHLVKDESWCLYSMLNPAHLVLVKDVSWCLYNFEPWTPGHEYVLDCIECWTLKTWLKISPGVCKECWSLKTWSKISPGVCIECWTLIIWSRMCPAVCIVLNPLHLVKDESWCLYKVFKPWTPRQGWVLVSVLSV